jgi:hypothetical protein
VERGARERGAGVCWREYVGVVTDGGVGVCRAILKTLGTGLVVVVVKEREGEGGRSGVYV